MSNTRHAENGNGFRQEKYCSSPEFERGLMGSLVAKRCQVLDDESDRALVWFIQLQSHAPGGLDKLAATLIEQCAQRIGSRSMLKYGFKPGQVYDAEKTRSVRAELSADSRFPLKGGYDRWLEKQSPFDVPGLGELLEADKSEAAKHPASYAAADLSAYCLEKARAELPQLLAELCLKPEPLSSLAPRWFARLIETLRDYQSAWIAERSAGAVITSLGSKVFETLDYALESRCLVLLDGLARTGKTHAVKAWCDLHPGRARYVQVPSSSDDIGFFRAIAKSLGVSINQNSKAQQLRDRVEEVLQGGDLMVVFDEAHYLWPQSKYRDALPARVNWIMTALVNHGVPVGLATTPQFMLSQKQVEKKTAWTSQQFIGRIGHYEKLPDALTVEDCKAVASAIFPDGCAKSIDLLACYAQTSDKYLAAIQIAVTRARFLASKAGRDNVAFSDLKEAIQGSAIPSDKGLALALAESGRPKRSRAIASHPRNPGEPSAAPTRMPVSSRPALDVTQQPEPQNHRTISASQLTPGADRARQNLETA